MFKKIIVSTFIQKVKNNVYDVSIHYFLAAGMLRIIWLQKTG